MAHPPAGCAIHIVILSNLPSVKLRRSQTAEISTALFSPRRPALPEADAAASIHTPELGPAADVPLAKENAMTVHASHQGIRYCVEEIATGVWRWSFNTQTGRRTGRVVGERIWAAAVACRSIELWKQMKKKAA